ncbi:hypothetical protein EMIT0373P_20042 [Pseudomonas chlororaphis]
MQVKRPKHSKKGKQRKYRIQDAAEVVAESSPYRLIMYAVDAEHIKVNDNDCCHERQGDTRDNQKKSRIHDDSL